MPRSKIALKNRTALAQKQRQGTEQVSKAQSLALVKNLVRVSISTVCHLRNIFPNSCFKRRAYAGLHIYQLDASSRDESTNETVIHNEEAYMLTKWLECGVIAAIELKYLRRVEFIIACPELGQPLESYSFEMDYPENKEDHDMTFNGNKITTLDNIKGHVIQLIRSLMQFSDTLSEVPSERVVNMKLWYFDERTPADWEPKYFRAADPSELSFKRDGDHDILRIRIGEIQTPHHAVKVRFEGIDTTLLADEDEENLSTRDGQKSREGEACSKKGIVDPDTSEKGPSKTRESEQGNLLTCKVGMTCDDEDADGIGGRCLGKAPADSGRDVSGMVSGMMSNLQVSSKGQPDARARADEDTLTRRTDAARMWIAAQAKPTKAGLAKHLQINRELARDLMQQMVEEGLVIQDSNNRYQKVHAPRPSPMDEVIERSSDINDNSKIAKNGDWSSSQSSHGSDDSATQDPNDVLTQRGQRDVHFAMPPPRTLGRRSDQQFTTPPAPASAIQPDMQPAPARGKPQQERVLCMGTKRILDETELSKDGLSMQRSDPAELFDVQTGATGGNGSISTLGYEVSLSQASNASSRGVKKCSLVVDPIRQSTRSKRLRSSMDKGSPM
ncbi:unnamed protein product [Ascophyllum nodosum]